MRNKTCLLLLFVFSCALITSILPAHTQAAFNRSIVMDDAVFNDSGSMSAAGIDAFLNARSSCLSTNSGFSAVDPIGYSPSGGYQYGGNVSAGTVILHAAQTYGLNPQVLLATLQKEQSLVTSTSCSTNTIAKAVGYACPDSGGSYSYSGVNLYARNGTTYSTVSGICVNSAAKAGFSQQLIRAAWLLKFSQQRALGNTGWAVITGNWDNSDDLSSCYSGFMTQGTFKRCPNDTPTYFDGWATIDGTATHMDTGAAAALYRYTPHFNGNQNFVNIFESWFTSTIGAGYYSCGANGSNVSGATSGNRVLTDNLSRNAPSNFILAQLNNTGSKCIEAHTWTNDMQRWTGHVATNRPSISPADAEVITADLNGDGKDELLSVEYRNTSSGLIEVHVWDGTYQHWAAHIATNHPAVDPADNEVIAADTNGDGRDELFLVQYRNTASGMVEVHGWTSDFRNYVSHIATNHPAVDPADNEVIAADSNGDGRDEFALIQYQNTASGRVELHGWTSSLQGWASHIATNRVSLPHADSEVISYDSNGDGRDEFALIQYQNTASGRVELHGWTSSLQGWASHIAATP